MWNECTWYGYMCGDKERAGKIIERAEGWRGILAWSNLETMGKGGEVDGKGLHEHRFRADYLPNIRTYHKNVGIQEKEIIII